MTLKTSLIITGDASVAKKAVEDLNASIATLADKSKAAAPAIAKVDEAQAGAAASAKAGAAATMQLGTAQEKAAGGSRALAQSTDTAKAAQTAGATAARDAAAAQQAYSQTLAQAATDTRTLVAANDEVTSSTAAVSKQLADIGAAQTAAAAGADTHAAAAEGLQGEIKAMVAQIAGGSTVFQAMTDRGGAFASALADVAQASATAKAGIDNTGKSGEAASVDLGGLGDTVTDVAGGVESMGGKLGSAAAILAGPWGGAIGIGINLLGGFAAGLVEGALETNDLKSSSLSLVDALDKEKFATDAAREAIKDYNEQQDKARKATELATRQSLAKAEADLKEAAATREKTKALLADYQAQSLDPRVSAADPGTMDGSNIIAATRTASIAAELKVQSDAIAALEQARRELLITVGTQKGEAAADPMKAIDLKYNLQRQQADEAAKSNTKLARTIDQTIAAIERRREAEKKAEQERQQRLNARPDRVSLGNQVEAGSAAAMLATAERYRGLSENRSGDRAQLRDLFKQANVSVDPTMVAWCAAFVNSVLAANGVKGTGSLSARSFLGYGESTDSPNKGDIVVSKRGGNAAQGHVGFYQGTDAKGRVLVLGGNTGDRVATQAVARTDVLGFRRAPTAADAYKESQKAVEDARKAAADAAKEQQRNLDQVIARYLPATAAARDYADELARIDALAKSYNGKDATSGLTPEQANAARAALKTVNDKRVAEIDLTPEAKAAADAKKSIDGVVASLGKEMAARQTLDPVQRAMIEHQADLAKLSDTERTAYEAKLTSLYAQDDAYRVVEEATRAAADAQRQLRDMALDAFDAIVLGGEKAGDVIDRLARTLASAAIEGAVLGTGPLAALMKSGTAAPAAATASAGATQATADLVGKSVGKSVGDRLDGVFGRGGGAKALQNAGYGYTAASVTGGSGIGGAIGGAAGGQIAGKLLSSALGSFAGPFGSIAGGVLGGVIGGLFKKASPKGAVSITGSDASSYSGSGKYADQLGGNASTIQGQVQDIAKALGGGVGGFGVAIGKNGDWYHVSGDANADVAAKHPKSSLIYEGKDEASAVAAAIANAIADGAVTGLSARVQKAIQSSADVNKALAEALKVQDLELLVGGINAQIDKAFRDFETQAKERLWLASAYGFDVVEIEKRNGEDRVKLAQQLATQQVGSLQKLIDEITQGSLFEGSALDRITVLNTAIAKAKTDLDGGVEGAADILTGLYQQRLAASKEAYGTTSGYAADRTATLNEARTAVAAANARILAAQVAKPTSDPALATTNATLDEISDQSARMIAALEANNDLLSQWSGGSGGGFNLAQAAGF